MAEKVADAFDINGLKPVIGATFAMEQAKDAFAYASSPDLFGKVVITLA
jgi:NADPH:quinone reductase-like Zn-dependent oxidoreductase